MKVRDIMKADVITLRPDMTYREAAQVLYQHKLAGAPVVNEKGDMVGVFSEKDLYKVLYPYYSSYHETPEKYTDFEERENKVKEIQDNPISKYMVKEVVTIDPAMPVMKAGGIMLAKGINRLPVVENGKLVGIVARKRLFRNILEEYLDL